MFAMVKAIVPRYRYDQLMRLGWKIFLPTSLVAVAAIGYYVTFLAPAVTTTVAGCMMRLALAAIALSLIACATLPAVVVTRRRHVRRPLRCGGHERRERRRQSAPALRHGAAIRQSGETGYDGFAYRSYRCARR